jgi:hypothetical protein
MIGKAKSVSGSVAGMEYLQEEGKGYELDRNFLLGETPKEIMREFRMQQTLNTTCDKNMITAVISPHISDGEKLSDKELKEIGIDFMEKLKIDTKNQAYIMIVHDEKAHKHIHIYANRINRDGKAINDTYIGKRAQLAAHEIAKEKGLISAREIMLQRKNVMLEKNSVENIKFNKAKSKIFSAHSEVLKSEPNSLRTYILKMENKGFEVYPVLNKQNKLQGLKVYDKENDLNLKMSEVNRSMSLNSLLKKGIKNDLNVELKNEIKNITKSVSHDIKINIGITPTDLEKALTPNPEKLLDKGLGILKPLVKGKMTKEEFLQHLKDQQFLEEVVTPLFKHEEFFKKLELESEKKEEEKIQENKELDIEKEEQEKDESNRENNLDLEL